MAARPPGSSSFMPGLLTVLAMGIIWGTVVVSVPKQGDRLFSPPPSARPDQNIVHPSAQSVPPVTDTPISPPGPSSASAPFQDALPRVEQTPVTPSVALKCEDEIEKLCPDTGSGGDRRQCVQNRQHQFPPSCRRMIEERITRFRETIQQTKLACEEDVRRFCGHLPMRGGPILQCLKEHAQEVSDRCYQTLPKGSLQFRN